MKVSLQDDRMRDVGSVVGMQNEEQEEDEDSLPCSLEN